MSHWAVSAFSSWPRLATSPPALWLALLSPKNCHPDGGQLHMSRSGHRELSCSSHFMAKHLQCPCCALGPASLPCPASLVAAILAFLCSWLPSRGCYASSSSFCSSSRQLLLSLQLYFSEPVLALACMLGGVWVAGEQGWSQLTSAWAQTSAWQMSPHDWPLFQVGALQRREEKVVWRPLEWFIRDMPMNFHGPMVDDVDT